MPKKYITMPDMERYYKKGGLICFDVIFCGKLESIEVDDDEINIMVAIYDLKMETLIAIVNREDVSVAIAPIGKKP